MYNVYQNIHSVNQKNLFNMISSVCNKDVIVSVKYFGKQRFISLQKLNFLQDKTDVLTYKFPIEITF